MYNAHNARRRVQISLKKNTILLPFNKSKKYALNFYHPALFNCLWQQE